MDYRERIRAGVRRLRERCAGRGRSARGDPVAVGPIVAAGRVSQVGLRHLEYDMVPPAEQLVGGSAVAKCSNHEMCIEFGFRCPAAAAEGYISFREGGTYTISGDLATVGGGQGLYFYTQEYLNIITPEQQFYGQGLLAVWHNAPNPGDGGLAAMQQQYNQLQAQRLYATLIPWYFRSADGTITHTTIDLNIPPILPDEGDAGA